MKTCLLSISEVLQAYDKVSTLYPYAPSLSMWRAWECAAYQRYRLEEPVIDIGCGDGRFFRFLWPGIKDVQGIDLDAGTVHAARQSGVYQRVFQGPAHELPLEQHSMPSAFANCSIEHMDALDAVFKKIYTCLRPKGKFLLSVVTDMLLQWADLPYLLAGVLSPERKERLVEDYKSFHHLVSAFDPEGWRRSLEKAGFAVLEHIPILPEVTSRFFLLLDQTWHLPLATGGEIGDKLFGQFSRFPKFPNGGRKILEGLMMMENNWEFCSGAVFYCEVLGDAGN